MNIFCKIFGHKIVLDIDIYVCDRCGAYEGSELPTLNECWFTKTNEVALVTHVDSKKVRFFDSMYRPEVEMSIRKFMRIYSKK